MSVVLPLRLRRVVTTCAVSVPLIGAGTWLGIRIRERPAGPTIEPPLAVLKDRLDHPFETAEATFRLANHSGRPTTVTGMMSSCSCTVAEVEGDRKPPFSLAPGQSITFRLRVDLTPTGESSQRQEIGVDSRTDGRKNPPQIGRIEIPMADDLRPDPPSLSPRFVLAGRAGPRAGSPRDDPGCSSRLGSDGDERPGSHRGATHPPEARDMDGSGGTVHYVLEAKMAPGRGGISATGSIEIFSDGRKVATIPVSCTLERPYRLSREVFSTARRDRIVRTLLRGDRPWLEAARDHLRAGWVGHHDRAIRRNDPAMSPDPAATRLMQRGRDARRRS